MKSPFCGCSKQKFCCELNRVAFLFGVKFQIVYAGVLCIILPLGCLMFSSDYLWFGFLNCTLVLLSMGVVTALPCL